MPEYIHQRLQFVRALNVLILDDSPLLRQRLKERIEKMGATVFIREAANIQAGLNVIRFWKPDAVILDLQMTGASIDTLTTIKGKWPGTVVIVVTGDPLPQFFKRSREAGADFFFDICSDIDCVIGVIREMTERRAPV